jgi:hypothetical protein
MKLDLRYIAGFMDADGCIAIARFSKPGSIHVRYQPRVTATNCDRRIPDAIQKQFGGSVHQTRVATGKHRCTYNWIAVSKTATDFIEAVYPFLVVKKEQAKLVLKLQKNIEKHKHTLGGGNGMHTKHWLHPRRDAIMAERQALRDEVARLKRV